MIDASLPPLLSLLDQRVPGEVDAPPSARIALGNPARRRSVERRAGRILSQSLDEPIWFAIRRETNRRLVRFPFLELSNPPRVSGVQAVLHHARERVLAATFQLHERLRLVVQRERCSLAVPGWSQPVARHDRPCGIERAIAIHRDVQRDDREGLREIVDADERGAN